MSYQRCYDKEHFYIYGDGYGLQIQVSHNHPHEHEGMNGSHIYLKDGNEADRDNAQAMVEGLIDYLKHNKWDVPIGDRTYPINSNMYVDCWKQGDCCPECNSKPEEIKKTGLHSYNNQKYILYECKPCGLTFAVVEE